MKKLVFIILIAAVIAVAFNLPARILQPLLPSSIYLQSVQGTIWQGQAQAVRYSGKSLGTIHWRVLPQCLTKLSLCLAVKQQLPSLQSAFILHWADYWHLTELTASGDMKHFSAYFEDYRITPRGHFNIALSELQFAQDERFIARGNIEIKPLWLVSVMRLSLGDISAEIEPAADPALGSVLQITNQRGHLDLAGDVQLTPELSYESQFTLIPNENTNRSVRRILRYLRGYKQGAGVQLSFDGQLHPIAD